jgi:purine-binding chemotaxis protein CheW
VLNLVDTMKWLKLKTPIEEQENKYYLTLGRSRWCLACESIEGTKILNKDQIQWRQKAGKRSWAAGIVKDEKCVLIHADEWIKLFDF